MKVLQIEIYYTFQQSVLFSKKIQGYSDPSGGKSRYEGGKRIPHIQQFSPMCSARASVSDGIGGSSMSQHMGNWAQVFTPEAEAVGGTTDKQANSPYKSQWDHVSFIPLPSCSMIKAHAGSRPCRNQNRSSNVPQELHLMTMRCSCAAQMLRFDLGCLKNCCSSPDFEVSKRAFEYLFDLSNTIANHLIVLSDSCKNGWNVCLSFSCHFWSKSVRFSVPLVPISTIVCLSHSDWWRRQMFGFITPDWMLNFLFWVLKSAF